MRTILSLCVVFFSMFTSFTVDAGPVSVKFAPASPLKIETFQTKDGWSSPQGNCCEFVNTYNVNTNNNIAYKKTVTVSSTISGYDTIHKAEYLTDGKYGNGSSWIGAVGQGASTATIDLGSVQTFRAISFGRDRLGGFSERNPGVFSVEAWNEGDIIHRKIVDSAKLYLPQAATVLVAVNGNEGIQYRYVKFSFNEEAAIDEIEIFTNVP